MQGMFLNKKYIIYTGTFAYYGNYIGDDDDCIKLKKAIICQFDKEDFYLPENKTLFIAKRKIRHYYEEIKPDIEIK